MNKVLLVIKEIVTNRRLIGAVIMVAIFTMTSFGVVINADVESLTQSIVEILTSLSALLVAVLNFWSYLQPKK
jgi:hypothetical protein